jgi:hypothetical protein
MKIGNILRNISMFTWELPQTIVALGIFVFHFLVGHKVSLYKNVQKLGQVSVYEFGDFEQFGGVSLGKIVFVNSKIIANRKDRIVAHEVGHTVQSLILGPLYLLVIGLPSLIHAELTTVDSRRHAAGKSEGNMVKNYYKFFTEAWADKLGNVDRS